MRIALISFLLISCIQLNAQFNVAIGYGLGYTQAKTNNAMFEEFNGVFRDSTYKGDPMPDLHFLHGLSVGVRWKYEFFSLGLSWENLGRTREAIGEDDLDQLFSKVVFYSLNSYTASLESYFGKMGAGVGVGYRRSKVREEIANSGRKVDIVNEPQFFIKPYLSFNLRSGDYVGLSIKPYISIPLNSINLNGLAEELNVANPAEQENFLLGGVTLVFYNGYQSN